MSYVLGVDLGTTYSAAAISEGGRAEIVHLGTRQATIPSVVVLREDGEVLVGEAAERRALSEPGRVAREFKRRLGDPTPLILGGTPYGAEALMAKLLEAIVANVTQLKGEPPARVVITHPASYGPYKMDLLRQAARMADVEPVTLISEPVAAAVHYTGQERIETGAAVAVYDFGGGTFDAAVLRRTEDGFELLGEGEGLERLGGIDFDEAIYTHVGNSLDGALASLGDSPAAATGVLRLREECARAKESLSVDTDATIPVLLPNVQTDVRITRAEFENIIRPRIRETVSALERAVRRSGLTMDQIGRILLVGGSSRIPLVAEMVREGTGRPVAVDAQPKHAIALGAATMAAGELPGREAQQPATAAQPVVPPPAQGVAAEPTQQAPAPAAQQAAAGPETQQQPVHDPNATVVAPAASQGAGAIPGQRVPPGGAGQQTATMASQAAGATGAGAEAPPPSRPRRPAASGGSNGGRGMMLIGIVGIPVVLIVAAVAGFLLFSGGGDDGQAAEGGATETAEAEQTATAEREDDRTATAEASETATATAGTVEDTPTPTATPTATATPRPELFAEINNITISSGRYVVDFSTFGFEPLIAAGRMHVHFFFDTVPPVYAGVPGPGPWILYDTPNPFTEYAVSDRPAGADQMCVLVANDDHSVIQGSGNCVDLP